MTLPARLRAILRKHYTPVRHLFRNMDGNLDGQITKQELGRSLKCLGIDLAAWQLDDLFRGLLMFAIEEGDVTLSFRNVQKALMQPGRVSAHILSQSRELNDLKEMLERTEDKLSKAIKQATTQAARADKAEKAEKAAIARAEKAEAEARRQKAAAKKEKSARLKASSQGEGLRAYLQFIEDGKEEAEQRAVTLAEELDELRSEVSAL